LYYSLNVFYFPSLTLFTSRSFCLTTVLVLVNDGIGALEEKPSAFYLNKDLDIPRNKIKNFSAVLKRILQ